jgi:hypothetical protein
MLSKIKYTLKRIDYRLKANTNTILGAMNTVLAIICIKNTLDLLSKHKIINIDELLQYLFL